MTPAETALTAISGRPILLCDNNCENHPNALKDWPCLNESAQRDLALQRFID